MSVCLRFRPCFLAGFCDGSAAVGSGWATAVRDFGFRAAFALGFTLVPERFKDTVMTDNDRPAKGSVTSVCVCAEEEFIVLFGVAIERKRQTKNNVNFFLMVNLIFFRQFYALFLINCSHSGFALRNWKVCFHNKGRGSKKHTFQRPGYPREKKIHSLPSSPKI